MVFELSRNQLGKLSELCLDISKGTFLATLAIPVISNAADVLTFARGFILGLLFTVITLRIESIKERL